MTWGPPGYMPPGGGYPYYPMQPPSTGVVYVPIPSDKKDSYERIMRKIEKRTEQQKKLEEETKKKEKEKNTPKPAMISMPVYFLSLMLLGVPIAMTQIWLFGLAKEVLKQSLK